MRKQDIKPGVVYAYQESKTFASPRPVVFLAAAADARFYTRVLRKAKDEPAFKLSGYSGYPVVLLNDPDDAGKLTLADFEAATSANTDYGVFSTVKHLGYVLGPYDDVKAAHDAKQRAEQEEMKRRHKEADASRARAIDIITRLSAYDITVNRIGSYGAVDSVSLPLDEAEKLIARLGSNTGQED